MSHNKAIGQRGRREEVLALLGNKCIRCGFSDKRALQIDHIKGGGSRIRRRQIGGWSIYRFYRDILTGRVALDTIQLLCANCNWIKREEEKEYGIRFAGGA